MFLPEHEAVDVKGPFLDLEGGLELPHGREDQARALGDHALHHPVAGFPAEGLLVEAEGLQYLSHFVVDAAHLVVDIGEFRIAGSGHEFRQVEGAAHVSDARPEVARADEQVRERRMCGDRLVTVEAAELDGDGEGPGGVVGRQFVLLRLEEDDGDQVHAPRHRTVEDAPDHLLVRGGRLLREREGPLQSVRGPVQGRRLEQLLGVREEHVQRRGGEGGARGGTGQEPLRGGGPVLHAGHHVDNVRGGHGEHAAGVPAAAPREGVVFRDQAEAVALAHAAEEGERRGPGRRRRGAPVQRQPVAEAAADLRLEVPPHLRPGAGHAGDARAATARSHDREVVEVEVFTHPGVQARVRLGRRLLPRGRDRAEERGHGDARLEGHRAVVR
mmetsp:Transcript_42869/g.84209  ORF Transcript_42869/g.84209 Transcript_42869/m.84209 type:complete len:386 (-) Transcript_42869:1578-2735(-)